VLPTKVRNSLRSSPDPFSKLSQLRETLSPAQFPALVNWLANFGNRSHAFHSSRRPKSIAALRAERRILNPLPLADELRWALATIVQYKTVIQEFIDVRKDFSHSLLKGSVDEAITALDEIEGRLGISLWSIEVRFALLQLGRGLEVQKAWLTTLREQLSSGTVEFIAYFLSERNEETINPERFRSNIIATVPLHTTNPEFATYALFHLANYWSATPGTISTLLRWEYNSSLVDYYESLVRLMTSIVVRRSKMTIAIATAIEELNRTISDERIKKLCFLLNQENPTVDAVPPPQVDATNSYNEGRLLDAIEIASAETQRQFSESLFIISRATADQGIMEVPPTRCTIWNKLADLLVRVSCKSSGYEEAYAAVLRLATNLQSTHFAASVAYAAKNSMSSSVRPDDALGLTAFVNSDGIPPWTLQFLSTDGRLQAVEILESQIGGCASLRAELLRSNLETDETGLSGVVQLEAKLDAAWTRGEYGRIVDLANAMERNDLPRHRRYVWRSVANALIKFDHSKAIEYIVTRYLLDPDCGSQLPIKACFESLSDDDLQANAGNLSTPILIELYSRFVEDRPTELRYALEDFLSFHNIDRPSNMTQLLMVLDKVQAVHYLRYVSVPRVMQLCTVFENSKAVENERLAICNMLKGLDPDSADSYDAEIREITRRQSISLGLQQVEQSKIWIDEEPLRRWAEKHLQESFIRYQSFRLAGLDTEPARPSENFKAVDSEIAKSSEVPELPDDNPDELLMRMVDQFVSQCFTDRQHGLGTYLSVRIRHGVLSGHLRAPLEAEKIVTLQREAGSGDYVPNQYWLDQLARQDALIAMSVDTRLRAFSRDFDRMVGVFTDDYIQIKSEGHKLGLFVAGYVPRKVALMKYDMHQDTPFGSFVDLCLSVFWDSVDRSLISIRDHIDKELVPNVNKLFVKLLSDVEEMTQGYSTPELDNAIRNAYTHVLHAIEQVKAWFRKPTSTASAPMPFRSLVEVSLEAVKHMYRDFIPDVKYQIDDELPLFLQLHKFTDVFMIIFANIWRHCGLSRPKVRVTASQDDEYLHIEVANQVAAGVRNDTVENRMEDIRRKIAEGMYHRGLSSEGGTGFMKIRNIVGPDRDSIEKLEFGFEGDTEFRVAMKLRARVLTAEEKDHEDIAR
jgi:hypothetical protein